MQRDYLQSKVLTASGPRLHLILIEGALRLGQQAQEALAKPDTIAASAALARAIDIAAELLAGVRHAETPINKQLTAIYRFLLRTLAQAYFDQDAAKVAEALRVLEVERTTWQQVCDRLASESSQAPIASHFAPSASAPLAGISFQV